MASESPGASCEDARVHLAVVIVGRSQAATEGLRCLGSEQSGERPRVGLKLFDGRTAQSRGEFIRQVVLPRHGAGGQRVLQLGVLRLQLGEGGLELLRRLRLGELRLGVTEPCAVRGGLAADLGQLLAGPVREVVLRCAGLRFC